MRVFWGIPGAPVWHLHESLDRLRRLCDYTNRVCFGSSGAYATFRPLFRVEDLVDGAAGDAGRFGYFLERVPCLAGCAQGVPVLHIREDASKRGVGDTL
jgi:hypothetical protein